MVRSLLELAVIHCMIKLVFLILVNINWDFTIFRFFMNSFFFKRFINRLLAIEICGRFVHSIFILWHKTLLSTRLRIVSLLLLAILRLVSLELIWLVLVLNTRLGCFVLSLCWWRILLCRWVMDLGFWDWAHINNSWDLLWFGFWATSWIGSWTWVDVLHRYLSIWLRKYGWRFVHILRLLLHLMILGIMRSLPT